MKVDTATSILMNPHPSAIQKLARMRTYGEIHRYLKQLGLTIGERKQLIRLARKAGAVIK